MTTYGMKKNNAYAGEHVTPSGGRAVRIYYIDRAALAAINQCLREAGQRVPKRHERYAVRCGWYWITMADVAAGKAGARVGPYTSSRAAWQAAVQRLDNGKG